MTTLTCVVLPGLGGNEFECRNRTTIYKDACSRFILWMYAELTWFQADMYFSMQFVKQVCSPLDREEPGLGTHFSKQFSFIF